MPSKTGLYNSGDKPPRKSNATDEAGNTAGGTINRGPAFWRKEDAGEFDKPGPSKGF